MYKWQIQAHALEPTEILDRILENRGLTTPAEKERFLNPPPVTYWLNNLPPTFLESLKAAKKLILKAIENDMPIVVHGDYDVDGVCATAILYTTFTDYLNYSKSFVFIPNRFDHGYGLSHKSIDASINLLKDNGVSGPILFITVDSGITSVDEVEYLRELGHKVLITDHHQQPEKLPRADEILWYDRMVGASISWILALALGANSKDHFCYACLATVTDLQPLLDFNRSVVKFGLAQINKRPPLAFKNLLDSTGKNQDNKEVTAYDLGWVLGPRLNASGRLKDAAMSLQLLLEKDPDISSEMAWQLNRVNSDRQDKTVEMYDLASEIDSEEIPKIIVSAHDAYHEGIIGLVASRIVQQYNRPAIVISTSEEVAKGSVRSIEGINIIEILRRFDDLFLSLGGHPMAAGFSIEHAKIPLLKNNLEEYARGNIDIDDLVKVITIDVEMPLDLVSLKVLNELEKMHPHGIGNPSPVFASRNIGIVSINTFGRDNNHTSFRFTFNGQFYKAVFFNMTEADLGLAPGDLVDIVYSIKENRYNGNVYLDLILKDIKKL